MAFCRRLCKTARLGLPPTPECPCKLGKMRRHQLQEYILLNTMSGLNMYDNLCHISKPHLSVS